VTGDSGRGKYYRALGFDAARPKWYSFDLKQMRARVRGTLNLGRKHEIGADNKNQPANIDSHFGDNGIIR
jgi:hypothetical protein